jgi:hypothetical protein
MKYSFIILEDVVHFVGYPLIVVLEEVGLVNWVD